MINNELYNKANKILNEAKEKGFKDTYIIYQ